MRRLALEVCASVTIWRSSRKFLSGCHSSNPSRHTSDSPSTAPAAALSRITARRTGPSGTPPTPTYQSSLGVGRAGAIETRAGWAAGCAIVRVNAPEMPVDCAAGAGFGTTAGASFDPARGAASTARTEGAARPGARRRRTPLDAPTGTGRSEVIPRGAGGALDPRGRGAGAALDAGRGGDRGSRRRTQAAPGLARRTGSSRHDRRGLIRDFVTRGRRRPALAAGAKGRGAGAPDLRPVRVGARGTETEVSVTLALTSMRWPQRRHFIRTVLPATLSSPIWYLALQFSQRNFNGSAWAKNRCSPVGNLSGDRSPSRVQRSYRTPPQKP